MATTIPTDPTKANSDAGTDDPGQAILVDLAGVVDWAILISAALAANAQLNIGEGLEAVAQTDPTPNDLRVKLQAVSGLLRAATGIAVDLAALQKQSYTATDDTGAADAYVLTLAPAIAAYAKYQAFSFVAVATNTGASTLAVNGLAAKAIKKWKGGSKVALEAGDITAAQLSVAEYDGADFVLVTAAAGDDYILIEEQQASGVQGGSFTSGAWRTRDLNTEVADTGGDASVASKQVTLSAGTYEFEAWAVAQEVGNHKVRLQNVTDATTIGVGSSERLEGAEANATHSTVAGRFTISASKVIELQHRCSSTRNNDGFGDAAGFGVVEVYAQLKLRKVA